MGLGRPNLTCSSLARISWWPPSPVPVQGCRDVCLLFRQDPGVVGRAAVPVQGCGDVCLLFRQDPGVVGRAAVPVQGCRDVCLLFRQDPGVVGRAAEPPHASGCVAGRAPEPPHASSVLVGLAYLLCSPSSSLACCVAMDVQASTWVLLLSLSFLLCRSTQVVFFLFYLGDAAGNICNAEAHGFIPNSFICDADKHICLALIRQTQRCFFLLQVTARHCLSSNALDVAGLQELITQGQEWIRLMMQSSSTWKSDARREDV